jgi:hypothetical protein
MTPCEREILERAVHAVTEQVPDLLGLETPIYRLPPERPSL